MLLSFVVALALQAAPPAPAPEILFSRKEPLVGLITSRDESQAFVLGWSSLTAIGIEDGKETWSESKILLEAPTEAKVSGYCLMAPTPNPALFAATPPPIPAQEAPFGWQLPTIHPTHTPATHPASPHSPETARLEFLST